MPILPVLPSKYICAVVSATELTPAPKNCISIEPSDCLFASILAPAIAVLVDTVNSNAAVSPVSPLVSCILIVGSLVLVTCKSWSGPVVPMPTLPANLPSPNEPVEVDEPLTLPSPVTVIEPVIESAPVTFVFALVYSKLIPFDATRKNLPALAEVIPGIPLPTEKCALPDVVSSKVKSALFVPVAFI